MPISQTTNFANVPAELKVLRQWVCHVGKRPVKPDGSSASSTNRATWSTFDDVAASADRFDGIGFVFSADDPFVGIDLDRCRDAATGVVAPWAREIVEQLATYLEVSPSGTGLHLIARGELPSDTGKKADYAGGKVEAYSHGRYFCTTGDVADLGAKPIAERTGAIAAMWAKVFEGDVQNSAQSPIDAVRAKILNLPDAVSGDAGHDKTYHAACEILRHGVDGDEGRALLDDYNAAKCDPPWSKTELDHKWKSALEAVLRGREFGIVAERAKGFTLDAIDFVDFMGEQLTQEYLVDNVVAEQQHLLIGGPKKVLKTCIGLDLGMSIASGSPFLGHFDVLKRAKVLIVSAESGRKTIQATCQRIRDARAIGVARGDFRLSFKRPQLATPAHLEAVRREIEDRGIGFAVIDPAYLCCRPAKGESSNVFDMGDVLYGFGAIGEQTGCTMAIMHHSTKGARRSGVKLLDLDDLSGSGFAEWARQFMLLNRLAPMTRQGVHRLSLNVGGSARHHGQYELTVDEGDDRDELIGARWAVSIQPWSDTADETAKDEAEDEQTAAEVSRCISALCLSEDGLSKTALFSKDHAAVSQRRWDRVMDALLDGGEVETFFVGNATRYRLTPKGASLDA